MNALERVRAKFKSPDLSASKVSKASKSPSAGYDGSSSRCPESRGAHPVDGVGALRKNSSAAVTLPLSRSQEEAARQDVLARLNAHPAAKRTFNTRFEGDMFIVALAIRGIGTYELAIAADRVKTTDDYAALLACLDQPEGSA